MRFLQEGDVIMVLKNKVAVITGAASGIGAAIAERCANEGMKVVLADIEEESLISIEKRLKSLGVETLAIVCDVSKEEDIITLSEKTIEAFGEVNLLFNNAGVTTGNLLWKNTTADWQWAIGVNIWGVINSTKTFVPIMLKQDNECNIINTASMAGLTAGPVNGLYSLTKHAIVSFSESLYYDLKVAKAKINVSVLCPAFVNTRIMDCERNRPSSLINPSSSKETKGFSELGQKLRKLLSEGMSPKEVADEVFDAIQKNKFYIITHKEFKDGVKQRMEDILNENNPTINFQLPPSTSEV